MTLLLDHRTGLILIAQNAGKSQFISKISTILYLVSVIRSREFGDPQDLDFLYLLTMSIGMDFPKSLFQPLMAKMALCMKFQGRKIPNVQIYML